MNPLDLYTKPWTGWDNDTDKQQQKNDSNPILDAVWDEIREQVHGATHDAMKQSISQSLVGAMIQDGLIDKNTGKALLPVVEFLYDQIDPCRT